MKTLFRRRLYPLTLCLWLGIAVGASGQEVASFETLGERMTVTPHFSWYKDSEGALTAEQALAKFHEGGFTAHSEEWLGLGLMSAPLWLAGTIHNETDQNDLVIELRNPRLSYADMYLPDSAGEFAIIENGLARPYGDRPIDHPMPAYPLTLAPGDSQTVLFRLDSTGDMRLRLWLWDHPAFTNRAATAYYPEMVGIGVYLTLALYHFLIFAAIRERSFLYLGLFIAVWLVYSLSGDGTGHKLLWQDWPWFALRCTELSIASMLPTFLLFTSAYLKTREQTPRLYRAVQGMLGLCLANVAFVALSDSLARQLTTRYVGMALLVLIVFLMVNAIRRGSRMALFFALSWVGVLACGALLVLLNMYLISAQWILGTPIFTFLFSLSILLWSFQLTVRLRREARQQRELLEQQVETLSGLLPICANCKKIRDDSGYWNILETYMSERADVDFTHGICPDCVDELYTKPGGEKA